MTNIATKLPVVRKSLTEINLCGWLGCATPGDTLEYHRGFLALDTNEQERRLPEQERKELIRVARRALWAAKRDLVHLVQRRYQSDDYGYFLIARPKPRQRSRSLFSLLSEEVK